MKVLAVVVLVVGMKGVSGERGRDSHLGKGERMGGQAGGCPGVGEMGKRAL
jgi:hypothetical protein